MANSERLALTLEHMQVPIPTTTTGLFGGVSVSYQHVTLVPNVI